MGNIENLGLEQTRVRTEKGYILTHGFGQTDDPTIYAIGDVAGPPWLAHKASYEGVLCVEALAGHSPLPLDVSSIPGCIYTYPQVASVGLTQREAEKNHAIKVGKFSFSANGQALALGEPHGFVKTIFDQTTGELLGAHMIGPGVSELIQGMVIAKTLQATEEDLKRVIFPHPTLSEVLGEAILDADGIALHKISKKT
jgi:dihydrolipoamide dehydrogenase